MRRTLALTSALLAGMCLCVAAQATAGIQIRKVESIVHGPAPLDGFRRPMALVADSTRGIILVGDTGNRRVALFDEAWRSRGVISFRNHTSPEIRSFALDRRGRLFVVNREIGGFEVLDSRGTRIAQVVPELPAVAVESSPVDIALGASGRIYLLYSGSCPGICVVAPNGATESTIGFDPERPLTLGSLVSLAVSPDETRIVLLDAQAEPAVRILDRTGATLKAFGGRGEGEGTFSLPIDVVWGPRNTLWITDTLRHVISVFDEDGDVLGMVGGFGVRPGQFLYPVGCDFLSADRIVVLERAGSRFQVLEVDAPSHYRVGMTLETKSPEIAGALSQPDKGGSWR